MYDISSSEEEEEEGDERVEEPAYRRAGKKPEGIRIDTTAPEVLRKRVGLQNFNFTYLSIPIIVPSQS